MSDILIRKIGYVGRITLNRPKTLNSLTADMISKIETALDNWVKDDNVVAVIIDAVGQKAFCAGGDVNDIYKQAIRKNFKYGQTFWLNEYRLNLKIAKYPKPYIALMQGFNMGGGVGISCHGSYRVVGENSVIAMPECGIGLIPDVGGSHLLARLQNNLGAFLGTTATRMTAGDAIYCNFADYFIPMSYWDKLIEEISNTGDVSRIVEKFKKKPPDSWIKDNISIIRDGMMVSDYRKLESKMVEHPTLYSALKSLQKSSPLSVAFTFAMLQLPEVANSIEFALDIEYRFTYRAQQKGDFLEGVRAMVVDKDKCPTWMHKSLEKVKAHEVNNLFRPVHQ